MRTSVFRLSSVGDAARGGSALGQCSQGLCAIVLQLLFQVLDRGKAFYVSQPLHPLDANPLAVQVTIKVKQVHLKKSTSVLKGGPRPLVHHPTHPPVTPFDGHCIDAIGREELSRRELVQINSGHAQEPSPTLSLTDPTHNPIGPAQHSRRGGQISARDSPANPAAGDMLPTKVHRLHYVHLEPLGGTQPAEGLYVAAASATETMIMPDHELAYGTTFE
jgi:hypothetical protein